MNRITALVTAFVFASGSAIAEVLPANATCSDASLAGNYTVLFNGTYGNISGDTPQVFVEAGLMNFNGAGTIEEFIYSSSVDGVLSSDISASPGTYSINASCYGVLNVAGTPASIFVNGSRFVGIVTYARGWAVTVTGTR
jgi:hypothetical protein